MYRSIPLRLIAALACIVSLSAFSTSEVRFENVPVFSDTKPTSVKGILAKPDSSGKAPAIVLWHTCGGVREHVSKLWPQYFTSLGYITLTIDSFGSRGLKTCNAPTPLLGGPQGVNRHITAGDPYGALRYLASLPDVDADNIALMGFSYGGIMIAYLSNMDFKTPEGRRFKALVSFYGHCSKTAPNGTYLGPNPLSPWLVVVGEKETPDFLRTCREIASRPGVTFNILPNAHHGWDQPELTRQVDDGNGNVMLYNKEATEQSKLIVRDFLVQQFGR